MVSHLSTDATRARVLQIAQNLIAPGVTLGRLRAVTIRMVQALQQNRQQCGPEIPQCGMWDAYTTVGQYDIHTCNSFFNDLDHQHRVRQLIHESAHAAGIGQLAGEAYVPFDCQYSEGDENVADAWAHFVHCALGLPAEAPETIAVPRPRQPFWEQFTTRDAAPREPAQPFWEQYTTRESR